MWQERLVMLVSGLFAIVAVGLAITGIFGTLTYQVASQSRSIGITIALGASISGLLHRLCNSLLISVASGLCAGLLIALLLGRTTRALVFGVQEVSIGALALTLVFVFSLTAVAIVVPALKAIRTDPAAILRAE